MWCHVHVFVGVVIHSVTFNASQASEVFLVTGNIQPWQGLVDIQLDFIDCIDFIFYRYCTEVCLVSSFYPPGQEQTTKQGPRTNNITGKSEQVSVLSVFSTIYSKKALNKIYQITYNIK